jgi:hypothetical protein
MNAKTRLTISAACLLALGAGLSLGRAALPAGINVEKVGFKTPESVMYDANADVYLVSNINVDGVPTKKDNNGFISRLNPDGTVQNLKWIAGGANGVTLNAPKGMAIVEGTLYVTDLDTVRKFDLTSGEALGEIPIEGTTFLNDLAADEDGAVYVSDTGLTADEKGIGPNGTDAVYRISSLDEVNLLAKGKDLTERSRGQSRRQVAGRDLRLERNLHAGCGRQTRRCAEDACRLARRCDHPQRWSSGGLELGDQQPVHLGGGWQG